VGRDAASPDRPLHCSLPSTRGRGLSDDDPDHTPSRLQEDADAFVDSIGEPVFLAGWSTGALWALGAAAANSDASAAVAVFEPTVIPVMRDDERASLMAAVREMGIAAADRRLADAAKMFHAWLGTEDEITALGADDFERCAAVVPPTLRSIEQSASYQGPQSTDPDVLAQVAAPVLLLRGERTRRGTFYTDSEAHVARNVADPHVREPLPGLGPWAPVLEPESVAGEMISIFESVQRLERTDRP